VSKNSSKTLENRKLRRKELRNKIDFSKVKKSIIKKCKLCGKIKNHKFTSSFNMDLTPQYRGRCVDCYNIYEKELKKKNRKRLNAQATLRKQKRRIRIVEIMGGKCKYCGYKKSVRALTLHHVDAEKKEYTISQIVDHNWDKIEKELKKCELVCFNCHMEIHEEIENKKIN